MRTFQATFSDGETATCRTRRRLLSHAWRLVGTIGGAAVGKRGFADSRPAAIKTANRIAKTWRRRVPDLVLGEPEIVRVRERTEADDWRLTATLIGKGDRRRLYHVWSLRGTGIEICGEPTSERRQWSARRTVDGRTENLRGPHMARRFSTWKAAARAAIEEWGTK